MVTTKKSKVKKVRIQKNTDQVKELSMKRKLVVEADVMENDRKAAEKKAVPEDEKQEVVTTAESGLKKLKMKRKRKLVVGANAMENDREKAEKKTIAKDEKQEIATTVKSDLKKKLTKNKKRKLVIGTDVKENVPDAAEKKIIANDEKQEIAATVKSDLKKKLTKNRKRKLVIGTDVKENVPDAAEKKIIANDEKQEITTTAESDLKKIRGLKEQARLALNALKKHCVERSGKSLFPDIDHAVGLTVVYKKPALNSNRARVKIPLPCPHRTIDNASICVIMPDLDQSATGRRDPDVDKQARQWAEKIEKDHGLTKQHYSKIVTKRQLEREYHTFSQRRALATNYDVFLVDVRVGKAVRSFLGKEFYKVHKEPLDFNYAKPLVTAIEMAVKTVVLKMQRYATRVHVSFGHLGQQTSDLASNFDAVVDALLCFCPGGLSNIRSLYVQPVGSSPSLPVYVDSGAASEVQLEKPAKRRRCVEQVTDECSTLPDGLKLAVRRNGKLRIIKEETGRGILYPTIQDEWEERDGLKPSIDPAKLKRKHAIKKKRMQKRLSQKRIKSGEVVTVHHE